MISVVILTYNEAINIERCLRSVSWSDDILVMDSGSTDGTCEIAKQLGARIIQRPFDDFAGQRNFAIDQGNLRHDWVLHLDADETVTVELKTEMLGIASDTHTNLAYRVPSRLMLMGRWLKYSGMYPSYQVRFGMRDHLRFQMVGHGQRELLQPDELGVIKSDLIHFNFSKGISEWLIKHAQYARDEARVAMVTTGTINWRDWYLSADPVERRRALKKWSSSMPMRPFIRFIYIYLIRRGFLDGWVGFQYAILIGFYQWIIDLNQVELKERI